MAYNQQPQNRAQKAANSGNRKRRGGRYRKNSGPNLVAVAAICLAAVAITGGLIAGCFYLTNRDKDSGTILENVSIAGVDVGGMTKEVARYAVEAATEKT